MKKIKLLILLLWLTGSVSAQYITPGTGVNWNLQEFVSNSGGVIQFNGSVYVVTGPITISTTDTINIAEQAYFSMSPNVLITVKGSLIVYCEEAPIIFSSTDQQNYFTGFRFENSVGSSIRQVEVNRAGGIKIIGSEVEFISCYFGHFNQSNSTGTIDLSQSSPLISSCYFFENAGPAILSAANGASSPQIFDCTIQGNVTSNINMPQINLGTSGADSVRIIGNLIIGNRNLLQVGGIAVTTLVGGNLKCRIEGNLIKDNRYGITQYGNSIGSLIRGNSIVDNNTQGLPNLGGSGINFFGNSTNISYVSANTITGNLWGITIQNNAQPNFGQLTISELSPGMNQIFDNQNSGTIYDFYNNTPNPIWAQNNYWGTMDSDSVEMHIFHQPDDPALGIVNYLPLYDPTVNIADYQLDDAGRVMFNFYPNPASDKIFISAKNFDEAYALSLFDGNGRLIRKSTLNGELNELDLSGIVSGSYLLQIASAKGTYSQIIIVSH